MSAKRINLVGSKEVGVGQPPYIIAEIGINHNGKVSLAEDLIRAAAGTGVDAVKFQKRTISEMYTASFLDQPYEKLYAFGATYGDHKRFLELSNEALDDLRSLAESLGMDFLVSGFDAPSFEYIEQTFDVPLHKIPSPFVTHYPLLEQVAGYGRPVVLSTGMHEMEEIKRAVTHLRRFTEDIILFQTTTMYPCPDELTNLSVLKTLAEEMDVLVGYSSHDKGVILPAASVALGACMIEKHFTMDRTLIGPDHAASVEPRGMSLIAGYAHSVFSALGSGEKVMLPEEKAARIKYGVSVVTRSPVSQGAAIRRSDLTVKCPGGGISPEYIDELEGRIATRDLPIDEIIQDDDLQPAG